MVGLGRFGDTTQGWFVRHFFIALFFPQLSSAGEWVVRDQTWMFVVHLAHIKCISHRRVITQRAATHPCRMKWFWTKVFLDESVLG